VATGSGSVVNNAHTNQPFLEMAAIPCGKQLGT
jgi:hypothetical protein